MPAAARHPARDDHQRLLASLNDRQREAVTASDGPILVIAGPGSGKTRVICARIAHLVRSGRTEPNAIAAITFTRKAADEMALRLRAMLPAGEAQAVWISTFHRLCGSLLREHGAAMGIPADFRIADEGEQIGVMRQCMWDAGVDTRVHKPQALIHRMSVIKNRMRVPASLDSWARRRARRPQRAAGRRLPDRAGRGRQPRLRRPAARRRAPAPRAPPRPAGRRRALPPHPGRRVPGHEPPAVRPVAPALRRPRRRLRRRRPRPGHLRLARGRVAEHPELPARLPRRPAHRPPDWPTAPRRACSRPPPR